jgi:hypothetical protein
MGSRGQPVQQQQSGTNKLKLKFADKVGQPIPGNWQEGTDYQRGGSISVGDLVIIKRSDGSLKFGQAIGRAGLPWQQAFEVAVEVDSDGACQASRQGSQEQLRLHALLHAGQLARHALWDSAVIIITRLVVSRGKPGVIWVAAFMPIIA